MPLNSLFINPKSLQNISPFLTQDLSIPLHPTMQSLPHLTHLLLSTAPVICRTYRTLYNHKQKTFKINMHHQFPTPFHPQSNTWNHQLCYPHSEFPGFQQYYPYHLLATLQFKFQALSSEFQKTREEMLEMQQQLAQVRQLQKKSQKVCTFILLKHRSGKVRKQFTKHLGCPFPQCKNKYSSRIALRAHIRRTHKPTQNY